MKKIVFTLACLVTVAAAVQVPAGDDIVIDDFENGLRPQWEANDFEGKTVYEVVETGDGKVLKATSNASATGLIYEYEYDPAEYPVLTWRWKVENVIEKGDARTRKGDDYAARVYVVFPHWFKPLTRSINYIWANRLPKGEYIPNPFFSRAVMIAVESGPGNVGKWITERRNVLEDYRMIFGEDPGKAGAIAIMTDTDNTGESAVAYYDDIRIERR